MAVLKLESLNEKRGSQEYVKEKRSYYPKPPFVIHEEDDQPEALGLPEYKPVSKSVIEERNEVSKKRK